MFLFKNKEETCLYLKNRFKKFKYFKIFLYNIINYVVYIVLYGIFVGSIIILISSLGILLLPLICNISLSEILLALFYTIIAFIISGFFLKLFMKKLNFKIKKYNYNNLFDYRNQFLYWKSLCD